MSSHTERSQTTPWCDVHSHEPDDLAETRCSIVRQILTTDPGSRCHRMRSSENIRALFTQSTLLRQRVQKETPASRSLLREIRRHSMRALDVEQSFASTAACRPRKGRTRDECSHGKAHRRRGRVPRSVECVFMCTSRPPRAPSIRGSHGRASRTPIRLPGACSFSLCPGD